MYNILCTYPLHSDLFALTPHPTSPLIALGLASGHVQINRLPDVEEPTTSKNSSNTIVTQWRTRRHRGSCRSLCFSPNGDQLLSAGTDEIVKLANTETGVVTGKLAVPRVEGKEDFPTILRALSAQTLLLATDSAALHVYDVRLASKASPLPSSKPLQTYHPHADYVTSLSALPSKSSADAPTQWLSTGGTTVAVTDLRRGVLTQSEDQDEELLSSTIIHGEKVLVGGEKGTLRTWQVGQWDDNETTVNVSRGTKASAEALAPLPDRTVAAVGMDDGMVRFVDLSGKKGIVLDGTAVQHDEMEGVNSIGFVNGGRMVSGGGTTVRIWEERVDAETSEDDGEAGETKGVAVNGKGGRRVSWEGDDSEEKSSEEDQPRRKKRRKKGKAKASVTSQSAFTFEHLD